MKGTDTEKKLFAKEEIANSKRIFKSQTPKGTIDWYIKWASSLIVLFAISLRSTGIAELQIYDIIFSWIGALGWFVVGLMWKDRAIILLNGAIALMLFGGLLNYIFGK